MKDRAVPLTTTKVNRKLPPKGSRGQRGGVPYTGVVLAVLCSGGVSWWAGDAMGFSRGYAEVSQCKDGDPLDRLDRQALRHERKRLEASQRREEPAPAPGVVEKPAPEYTFHTALQGAPGKTADRLPAAPMPKVALGPAEIRPPAPEKPAAVTTEKSNPSLAALPTAGDYTLQAGAFPDKDQALKLHDRLKSAGYHPVIVPSEAGGATWYRVRVGRFPDRTTADAGAAALSESAHVHGIALKH